MIDNLNVVAVIPARGGSKGVPRKNIRLLGNKPLIGWSIDVAKKIESIDRIIVSTDDDEISSVAKQLSSEVYMRPPQLAKDDSLIIDSILNLILKLKNENYIADIMVLLEPTCPFRDVADVKKCLKLLTNSKHSFDTVATFKEGDLNPHRAWKIKQNSPVEFIKGAIPWMPRQDLPKAYQLDGACYAFKTNKIKKSKKSPFGKIGSIISENNRNVDIDTELDFSLAELLIK